MQDLIVTVIQADLRWQSPEYNRSVFEEKINALKHPTHLVVLPEMFTTGFTMEADKWAEEMSGATVEWMKSTAQKHRLDLTGSLIIRERNKFFNRLIWVKPTGELFSYDKRHLFRMAGEHKVYGAGKKLLTVELNDWRIRPFICYDLRFPVWCRNVNLA